MRAYEKDEGMFTGLIEECGMWQEAQDVGTPEAPLQRVTITCHKVLEDTQLGDSIAVNGVCLTVVELLEDGFTADVMGETLRLTTIGTLKPGDPVNLERALSLGQRLGGHIVQGHVDTTGKIEQISPDHVVRISVPEDFISFVAYKGSITINGVSLTVSNVESTNNWCEVSLIPETLSRTSFGSAAPGDTVNIEVDALAKYVDHLLKPFKQLSMGEN